MLPEERRRILQIYREEVAGRLPVLAGIGAPTPPSPSSLLRTPAKRGRCIVVFPHPVFVGEPLPWQVPYEYHKAIAEAVPLPMVLFQLQPGLGGVLYSREALLKLASIPTVVAVKEASFDAVRFVETVRALVEAPRRIQMLTGNDNFILESFVLGADGALIGFGTVAIASKSRCSALAAPATWPARHEVYDRVIQPLVGVIFGSPVRNYRLRVKEALVELGVLDAAHARPPLPPLHDEERRRVREAVRRARLAMPRRRGRDDRGRSSQAPGRSAHRPEQLRRSDHSQGRAASTG